MEWFTSLLHRLEGFFQPGRPVNHGGKSRGADGAPRTAILAANLAAQGAAARNTAPPPKAPPPVVADATGVLHRDDAGDADIALDADGLRIHRIGKKWYDQDGNWVAYVPVLTKQGAIDKARTGGYGARDEAADAAATGIKSVWKQLPVLGGIIASQIDTGNGALSPAEEMRNNQILREQAAEVVLQDQIAAGDNTSAHGAGIYDQLDPGFDDLDPYDRESVL